MESTKELNSEESAKRDDLKVNIDQNSDKIIKEILPTKGEQRSKDIHIQDVGYFTVLDETKLRKSQDYEQSSDTSALMKLAEIACNTTDSQVNSENELSQEHKTGGTNDIQNQQHSVKERPFPGTEKSTDDTTTLHPLAEMLNMTESKSKENLGKVPMAKTSDSVDLNNLEENKLNLSNISLSVKSFSSDFLQKISTVDSLKNKLDKKTLELHNSDEFTSLTEIISKKNENNSDMKVKSNIGDEIDKVFSQERNCTKDSGIKDNTNASEVLSLLSNQHSISSMQGPSYYPENSKEKDKISENEESCLSQECYSASSLPQQKYSKEFSKENAYSAPSLSSKSLQNFSHLQTNLTNQDTSSTQTVQKDLKDMTMYFNSVPEISSHAREDESFNHSHIRIPVESSNISTIKKYKESKIMDKGLNSDNTPNNFDSWTHELNNDNIHSDICSIGIVKENDTKLKVHNNSSKLNFHSSHDCRKTSITQKDLDIQNSNIIDTNILNTEQDDSNPNLPNPNAEGSIQIVDKGDMNNKSNLSVETFEASQQGAKIGPVTQDSFTKCELTKLTSSTSGNNETDAYTDLKTRKATETDVHINLTSEATKIDAHIEMRNETTEPDDIYLITGTANIDVAPEEMSQKNLFAEAIIQLPSDKTSIEIRYQKTSISTDNSKICLDSTRENIEMESSLNENSKEIENNINGALCSQNKISNEKVNDSDISTISKHFTVVSKENFNNSKLNVDVLCEMQSSLSCAKNEQPSKGLSPIKMEILDEIVTNLSATSKKDESIESNLPIAHIKNTNLNNGNEKHDYSQCVINAANKRRDSSNAPSEIQETSLKEIYDHNNVTDMSCHKLLRDKTNLNHSLKIDLKEGEIFSDNENEEHQKMIGQLNVSRSQIQSGKIFVRKDLTESIDSDNDLQIPFSSSGICTNISVDDKDKFSNENRKRLLSGSSQNLPSSKKMTCNNKSKIEVADKSDLDKESLDIDETNKLQSTQKESKIEQAHEALLHIYSKEEESMIAIVASTEEICAKCKELWNHNTLKMLFEGNESVTINSRITYGAIICMNIFVGIHYPNFKEEALRGLLERADLAKNLGSIKVSILNSWLLALIKNKKINCCSPFRPIYRIKSRSFHLSDTNGKDSAFESKSKEEKVQNLKESEEKTMTESSSGNKKNRLEEHSKSLSELLIDGSNEDKIKKQSNEMYRKTTLNHSAFISSSSDSNEGTNQDNSYTFTKITVGGKVRNTTTKHNPTLHSIVLMEKDSLDPSLHPLYDNLVCESKITEAEARCGKRKYISNKEVLSIHSVCILNSKKLNLKNYFTLFLQILYHREYSIFIPDHKTLVKIVENLRREDNRHKYSLSKTKQFRQSPWDYESLYSASYSSLKCTDGWPTIREILTIFCLWKNRKLLPILDGEMNLAKEVSTLFQNKFEIKDYLGLCIRLYTIYCRLMFDESFSDVGKAKLFLNLHYLPKMEQDLQKDKIALNFSESFLLQTQNELPSIISYLEEQALDLPKTMRHTLPEIIIDCKLEQTKKLKRELLSNINDPLVTNLFDTYGKLKNEMNFLEEEKTLAWGRSGSLVHPEQTVLPSPQMKLMMAKLRVGNVPMEVIPSVMEKVFKNLLKRNFPSVCSNSPY